MTLSSRKLRKSLEIYRLEVILIVYGSGKDFMLDAIDVLKGVSI